MKKIILFLSIVSFTFALEVGDTVKQELLSTIGATKKVVIIDFFASWCVSCKKELPLINKLSKELQEVEFIGIDVDEEKDDGLKFQKKLSIDFSVFNDNNQAIIKQFNPVGVPAIYILQDKIVKKVHIGAIDDVDEVLKKEILELQ